MLITLYLKLNIMSTKTVKAWGATAADAPLNELEIPRRQNTAHDVEIEILYCGICHSDIHTVRSEWGPATYPVVPGHEIIGKVISVGDHVSKYKIGDLVGVGCLVDSCRECEHCKEGEEQFCSGQRTYTYNSKDAHLNIQTFGGYSAKIVVDENFVLRIPSNLDTAATAPLLCAGITTYSPLKHWNIGKGDVIGVVGIGGLGHMGIKIAKALGATVVVYTTSPSKADDAKRLGADDVVFTKEKDSWNKYKNKLDFILDTVSADHPIDKYLSQLKLNKTMCLVGLPEVPMTVRANSVVSFRRSLSGSSIGGIRETQEMLDFCAQHNIVSDIELIPIQKVNEAYERVVKADVKYRFVIDMSSLK